MADMVFTRRTALAAAGGVALSMPAFRRVRAAEVLHVNTWGGIWERAAIKNLFEPFTRDTGIEIRPVSPVSFAKLAQQVRSGAYEFDVTTLGAGEIIRANQANLLENLDSSDLVKSPPFPGAAFQNGASSHAFATVMAYQKARYPNGPPTGWADFWDQQKFPGSRCMQRYASRILPLALAADGVPTNTPSNQIYPMDINRAFRSLDKIKPNVRVWWTQGQQSQQLLRDGEIDLIALWHGRTLELIDEGKPIEIVWNQGQLERAYWVVARGTPRRDAAMRYLESALKPERVAGFCRDSLNGPLNPAAFQYLSAAESARMPTSPAYADKVFEQDILNFGGDVNAVTQRFERWIGS
ncbi:ABC transporter substrate-binding protein [Humitalea sp. 24SJ18S-53]|uniref:ABC transporter substrate-binding protein n=1 Tax=Humitalea sp. 24SJ18S-53 TaxID=3422307 RepID=UPI003D673AAA